MTGLSSLVGWRRYAAAYAFGVVAALAFPPFNLIPVLWLSFPALVLLLRGAPVPPKPSLRASGLKALAITKADGRAFAVGWCFAFGLLTLSLYWIAGALFVDIKKFWWVLPFAIAGLPAFFAFYYGLAALAAKRWGLDRLTGAFFLALCWFAADMARGHLFTGFPWDITGYVWGDCLPVMQLTSLVGIEGLTVLTLLLAVVPVAFLYRPQREAFLWCGLALAILGGSATWGAQRMHDVPTTFVPGVRLRLVQPSTDQTMKWSPEHRQANLEALMDLTFSAPGQTSVTHYIWPETATAYYLTEEPEVRRAIAAHMPAGSVLLTGVVRRQIDANDVLRYYNSFIAMDSNATISGGYDKHHLVPFGEYMPLQSVLPFRVISILGTGFTAGDGVHTMRAAGLPPFGPLVCYEAIFSGDVVEASDPPSFLLNVTNDGWYENTIGPAQHFAIARARAIEDGLPLVRVANKGITGVVDGYGRITAQIGKDKAGTVDAALPNSIKGGTFGEKQENKLPWLIVLATLLPLFFLRFVRKSHNS